MILLLASTLPAFAAVPAEQRTALAAFVSGDVSDAASLTASSSCSATWGSCNACGALTVTSPTRGTLDAFVTGTADGSSITSCGETWTYAGRALAYEVEDAAIAGEYVYVARTDTWSVLFDGDRTATATFTTSRGVRSFTSTATIAGSATIVGEEVTEYAFDAAYSSFAGHVWTASVHGNDTEFSGTLKRDDGASCVVTGTVEAGEVTSSSVKCSP